MSDDEQQYEPRAHKKLLQAISNLGNGLHIQKSTRNEQHRQQDEFQLIKSSNSTEHAPKAVAVNDLVQILRRSKHIETGKKLKNVHSTKKVLEKPLEKPQADRIKRSIGYEGIKKKLGRWDAVVGQQRSAETQVNIVWQSKCISTIQQYFADISHSLGNDIYQYSCTLESYKNHFQIRFGQRARSQPQKAA